MIEQHNTNKKELVIKYLNPTKKKEKKLIKKKVGERIKKTLQKFKFYSNKSPSNIQLKLKRIIIAILILKNAKI